MSVNKRIREIRIDLGYTQIEFAKKLGLSENAINSMEREGKRVTERNIIAISAVFGVNFDWLKFGIEPKWNTEEFSENDKKTLSILKSLSPPMQKFLVKIIELAAESETN